MKNGVLSNFTRSHISSDRVRSGYEITDFLAALLVETPWMFTLFPPETNKINRVETYKHPLGVRQVKMISAQHSSNNGKNWQKLSYQKILLAW